MLSFQDSISSENGDPASNASIKTAVITKNAFTHVDIFSNILYLT